VLNDVKFADKCIYIGSIEASFQYGTCVLIVPTFKPPMLSQVASQSAASS